MEGFAGKVAVVTGAGSGIGQALAVELARSGAKLAISDVDTEGLARTEERLKAIGAPVKADRIDVTERERFLAYADEVNDHFGVVNQIYNNAGIAFTGDIEVSQFKDIERVMDVDYWGVVNGTKAFLPHLIASGDGHVVNISSLFGIFSVPGQAAYNSAKFAVRGFTEALRQEMILAGHPVKVTTVHPGGIKTNIARNATAAEGLDKDDLAELFDKRLASTSPQRAARIILDAVRKNKARVLVGPDAKVLDLLVRVTGSGYQQVVSSVIGRLIAEPTNNPGGIKTNIARNATGAEGLDKDDLAELFDKRRATTGPQRAARIILDAVRKNKARILVDPDAKVLDLLVRLGSGYQRLVSSVIGRLITDAHQQPPAPIDKPQRPPTTPGAH